MPDFSVLRFLIDVGVIALFWWSSGWHMTLAVALVTFAILLYWIICLPIAIYRKRRMPK
jgi:hypothetical protein